MTVSRALRNDPNVSGENRERILEVAERENYLPARSRNGNSVSQSIAREYYVLYQDGATMAQAFTGEISRSVQRELFRQGRNCSFAAIADVYAEFLRLLDMLHSRRADGVILAGPVSREYINALTDSFTNVVLVDNAGGPGLIHPYNAISCEYAYGCALAVRHLLNLDRRRILLINGPEGSYLSDDLLAGYKQALEERDIDFDEELVIVTELDLNGGYLAAKRAIESGIDFDAVFANDELAFGAVKAVKEAGLVAPDDVAVAGVGNLALGEALYPALTTVDVDREEMGRLAVERLLLLESSGSQEATHRRINIFPKLLVRDSCGARAKTRGPAVAAGEQSCDVDSKNPIRLA